MSFQTGQVREHILPHTKPTRYRESVYREEVTVRRLQILPVWKGGDWIPPVFLNDRQPGVTSILPLSFTYFVCICVYIIFLMTHDGRHT